jgi:hypothetical protein
MFEITDIPSSLLERIEKIRKKEMEPVEINPEIKPLDTRNQQAESEDDEDHEKE